MTHHRKVRATLAVTALLSTAVLVLAGCTSSTPPTTTGAKGPDLAAAKSFLAPWLATGEKKLLIDQPLSKAIPAGTRIAFLDVGTPVAAVMWDILQPIVKLTGIKLDRIATGSDAQSINTAMNTVVESKYDGIINITLDPIFFKPQLKQLIANKVPIASGSVMDTVENGMPEAFNGPDWMKSEGQALAASAVVRTNGKVSDFALYTIPEFPFAQFQVDGFTSELKELCPSCNLRVVDIPIATLGSTSADQVVSDLQAHPETGYYVAIADEGTVGLPAKLNLAGITVKGLGTWSIPPNLQQVAGGTQDATFPIDFNLMMWTVTDQLFREMLGDSYKWPDAQTRAYTLATLLTKANASDYPNGYAAIPDMQKQFAALWHVGG
jgi:ABC-type sugar transport system substrate-binding protein